MIAVLAYVGAALLSIVVAFLAGSLAEAKTEREDVAGAVFIGSFIVAFAGLAMPLLS